MFSLSLYIYILYTKKELYLYLFNKSFASRKRCRLRRETIFLLQAQLRKYKGMAEGEVEGVYIHHITIQNPICCHIYYILTIIFSKQHIKTMFDHGESYLDC